MKVRIFSYNYTSLVYFNPFPVIIALNYDSYIENRGKKQKPGNYYADTLDSGIKPRTVYQKIHVQLLKKQRALKHPQLVLASCRCKDGSK